MRKTVDTTSAARRTSKLALAVLAVVGATGAAVADGGSGYTLFASGAHLNRDFNQDGRIDNRRLWFYAIEQSDGSVSGEARLRVLVDELDFDGIPDVEPFMEYVHIQIRGGARISDTEAVISGVVTASNDPVECSPADGIYSLESGTQLAFVVKDNGWEGQPDQITPKIIWDCVPFVGSDYGVDDSTSFAQRGRRSGVRPVPRLIPARHRVRRHAPAVRTVELYLAAGRAFAPGASGHAASR